MTDFVIIGAGLAGCECALTLARQGYNITLFEQKPDFKSPAHSSDNFAELVCSNSLRSNSRESGVGLLKEEMRKLGSAFMACADATSIKAGSALAVDREAFSTRLTQMVENESNIQVIRERAGIDQKAIARSGLIIAAGPLPSENIISELEELTGSGQCYFYDAIAPIVWTDSLDENIIFRASRYGEPGSGDYLNCPMTKEEYKIFYDALLDADTCANRDFENETFFEGCMPIEAMARRGERTLSFGPMKPVGLIDPRTGKRPWAVIQLRAENANSDTCNLVGCQTRLRQNEQEKVFKLVPGLADAQFARYGSAHRNTYVNAPVVLNSDMSLVAHPEIYLAGQISGVEGYVESAASGLWLGLSLGAKAQGKYLQDPPVYSAMGALLAHLKRPAKNFQPSNIHFGLMPNLDVKVRKKDRKACYAQRAEKAFTEWFKNNF